MFGDVKRQSDELEAVLLHLHDLVQLTFSLFPIWEQNTRNTNERQRLKNSEQESL